MSHSLEEESPWSTELAASTLGGTGFISGETEASPWAQADGHDHHNDIDYGVRSHEELQASSGAWEASLTDHDPYGDSAAVQASIDEDDPLSTLTSQRSTADDLSFKPSTADRVTTTTPAVGSRRRRRAVNQVKREDSTATNDDPLSSSIVLSAAKADSAADGLDDVSLAMSTHLTLDDRVREAMTTDVSLEASNKSSLSPPLSRTATDHSKTWSDSASSNLPVTPKIKFDVRVGDPSRVGELTNAYTVYTVHTDTAHELYPSGSHTVLRRYRDFRWLYRALESTHPGIIVPPPPEKQAVGRFNDEFIEQRSAALETMLRKIISHPKLVDDPDLRAFLTAEDFAEYLTKRVISDEELEAAHESGASGFVTALLGSKAVGPDAWILSRRNHLDAVEAQLRALFKALDAVSQQRGELSDTIAEFANVTEALANVEPTRRLGEVLRAFGGVYERLGQLYSRQRKQSMLSIEATINEHMRIVGSVRNALAARQRATAHAETAATELERKQASLEKIRREGRTQEDRMVALEGEIAHYADRARQAHRQTEEITHLVDEELQRVDKENMVELRDAVELHLETAVEAQKEAIELWETFYARYFTAAYDSTSSK